MNAAFTFTLPLAVVRLHVIANATQPMLGATRARIMANVQEDVLKALSSHDHEDSTVQTLLAAA